MLDSEWRGGWDRNCNDIQLSIANCLHMWKLVRCCIFPHCSEIVYRYRWAWSYPSLHLRYTLSLGLFSPSAIYSHSTYSVISYTSASTYYMPPSLPMQKYRWNYHLLEIDSLQRSIANLNKMLLYLKHAISTICNWHTTDNYGAHIVHIGVCH